MLKRSFSKQEKVMLLFLAIIVLVGLYILLIHTPTQNQLAALATEKEATETQLQIASARMEQYASMKRELEEIFALPEDQITVMPIHGDQRELTAQLNGIFLGLEPTLAFAEPEYDTTAGIAKRDIQFSFEAPSYEVARDIVQKLTHTGKRSLMGSLSIVPVDAQGQYTAMYEALGEEIDPTHVVEDPTLGLGIQYGPLKVSGTITFYEMLTAGQIALLTADTAEG